MACKQRFITLTAEVGTGETMRMNRLLDVSSTDAYAPADADILIRGASA